MSILFISDLHLDESRPHTTGLFERFLAEVAAPGSTLYILGDLFEVWLGDDAVQPAHEPAIRALRTATDRGLTILVMHGNRDFLLGQGFATRTGCALIPDPIVIDLYGTRTLLSHGDTLCTDDEEYQQFRAYIRAPERRAELLAMPPAERAALANRYRAVSREQTRDKPPEIMDVNPEAVRRAMLGYGVTQLIHGHTHRPASHTLTLAGDIGRRTVLGDWDRAGSVLRADGPEARLLSV